MQDRVVLVTGASRGIGKAIAKNFGKKQAMVIVNYLKSEDLAEQVVKEIEDEGGHALALQADVTQASEVNGMVKAILDNLGTIDVVVNNALHHYTFNPKTRKTAWELEWEDYQGQIDGSLKGTFNLCKAVLPQMKRQGYGRIINMVTNLMDFPVVPYHDYTTAKAAVLGYSRNLAKELGPFGITVNCVAPGLTYPTDSSRETQEDVREILIRLTPMGRLALPEDIAGAVAFLASKEAGFITGQCLRVDGGLTMT
ncbi:3-oxoacyl-ACP reductase [Desulfitobacterium metallireducens]|uniref:3-oxoacyl-ACP reductase n=1 Tax=Desulfitobacterium metallireducens DSM 15288 TaxID=871968 RepID=W0E5Y2_9FIRM|nr:3-oxoacyl-ACP reductase [Desulfitobacterium metallireducens]AHF06152.1 3-oxoacyl-ACP reductase [Desulfitobacterium metallireducens DSM 15288]